MQPLETYTICRTLQMIDSGNIRIPILQRDYVWNKDDVEKLFCSIYKEGVVCEATMLKITNTDKQIFDSRPLKKDINERIIYGQLRNQKLSNDQPLYLVIDGQQRLQSLYLGMTKRYGNFELYFHYTHNKNEECIFKYFDDDVDSDQWLSVKEFYSSIDSTSIIESSTEYINNFSDDPIVKENLFKLYYSIFFADRYIFLVNYANNDGNDEKRFKRFFVYTNHEYDNIKEWEDPSSKLSSENELYVELDKMSKYLRNQKEFFNHNWLEDFVQSLRHYSDDNIKACFKLLSFFPFVISNHKGLLEEITNNSQDIKSALIKYHHNQFKSDFDETNSLALTYFYIYHLMVKYKMLMTKITVKFDELYNLYGNYYYYLGVGIAIPVIGNSNEKYCFRIDYFDLYRGFDNKLLQDFNDEMLATIGLDSELQQQDTVLKNIAPPNLDIKWFNTQWGLDCTNINDLVTKGEELFNQEWNDCDKQFNRYYQPNIHIYD